MQTSRSHLTRVLISALALLTAISLLLTIAKSAAAPAANGVQAEIVRLERLQWDAIKKKDKATLAALLAKDYFDFGSAGRVNRATTLASGWLNDDESLSDFTIEDPQVLQLDDHTALITYRGTYRGTVQGKPDSGSGFYSDLYQKQGQKWFSVFTQDSNLKCAGM